MKLSTIFLAAAVCTALSFAGVCRAQSGTAPVTPAKAAEPAKTEPKKDDKPTTPTPPTTPAAVPATPAPASTPSKEPSLVFVKMSTNKGDVIIELDNEKAPISVANFLSYVDEKYYDGLIFHRIIPTFMVQGGGFDQNMKEKTTKKPIKNEWQNGLKNKRGTIAMARTQVADSATSQFFINVVDNAFLDQARDGAAYAVFGRVVSGMDNVDKIKSVKTTTKGMYSDVPVEPVVIVSIARISEEDAKKAIGAEKK